MRFWEVRIFSACVPLAVRFLSFEMILRLAEPKKPWKGRDLPAPQELADFVDRLLARRVLMRKQLCLRRSLVLYRFLRKLGLDVRINFGVAAPGFSNRLKAHAWLSAKGKPYLETGESHENFEIIHSYSGKDVG